MKFVSYCIVVAGILLLKSPGTWAQEQHSPGYHVIEKDSLGGDGGWDYVTYDDQANRLFISRSTHVVVFDIAAGKLVGDIPGTTGVHGIALDQEDGKGFTSNGRDSSVTIFDLKTLSVLGQVHVGQNPDDIFYDPAGKKVFTLNGGSHDASVIDPVTAKVVAGIKFNGRPEFAVSDGQGHFYVDLEDSSQIVTFDSHGLSIGSIWSLAPGKGPTGMALDRQNHRLFVGCSNNVMVIMDADSGRVVSTVPIGNGVDGLGFDSDLGLIFSSNGEGTLTVVHEDSPDKYMVLENVSTKKGARTMALDTRSHRIYTVTADFGPALPPTADRPHPRPSIVPGSFVLLKIGK